MRASKRSFTIIEILISTSILAVVTGSILGVFTVAQHCFYDGIAMAKSQATARIVIEKIARSVRHGSGFAILSDGDELSVPMTGSAAAKFGNPVIFKFEDNELKENGSTIGTNIVKLPNEDVFQELAENERVGINFGVKNEGLVGNFKEVYISTAMKLRN